MAFMTEVYRKVSDEPEREGRLIGLLEEFGGRLDYRECPAEGDPGGICLTFDFDDLVRAEAAADALRRRDEHVEGPVDYGPSSVVDGSHRASGSMTAPESKEPAPPPMPAS